MGQKIGVQAVLETADFQKGADQYNATLAKATGATEHFAGVASGPASAGLNAFQEVVTGALRRIGEVAINALGNAIGAIDDLIGKMATGAAEAETIHARMRAVITAGGGGPQDIAWAENLSMGMRDLFQGSDETAAAVLQVGQSMGTVSKDEMPKFMQQVADLAAVTGSDAPTAARLFARAYEDPIGTLRAFRTQNIMVDAQTKKTMERLVKQGKTEEAAALLLDRVGASTAGAAQTMASTTEGSLAIIREHVAEAGEDIGGAILGAVMPLLADAKPAIEGVASAFAELFTNADMKDALAGLGGMLREGIAGFGKWLRSPEVKQGLANLITGIGDLLKWLMSGGWKDNPLFRFLQFFGDWWAQHGPAISAVAGSVFGVIQTAVKRLADQIGPFISEVLGKLQAWFTDNGPLIAQFMAIVMTDFGTLVTIVLGAWTVIQPILGGLLDLILNIGKFMMQVAVGDWASAWETMKTAGTSVNLAIQAALMAFADWIASWFGTTWQGIKDQWAANWELFKLIVVTIWDNILIAVGEKVLDIVSAIGGFIDSMKAAVSDRIDEMKAAGTNLVVGLWIGIRDRIAKLKEDVANAIQSVVDKLKKILGLSSPSKLFYGFGLDLMEGLSQGVARGTAGAASQMQTAAATVAAPALAGATYSTSRTTNVNMDFNANYAQMQSPVTVRDDVAALLARVRR
jgi:phage-related protein